VEPSIPWGGELVCMLAQGGGALCVGWVGVGGQEQHQPALLQAGWQAWGAQPLPVSTGINV
jgi:hypothetical protein